MRGVATATASLAAATPAVGTQDLDLTVSSLPLCKFLVPRYRHYLLARLVSFLRHNLTVGTSSVSVIRHVYHLSKLDIIK